MKKALITGISGQDGSYLAELLLQKGYEVHGVVRRSSDFNTRRIDHIFNPEVRDHIHFGDLATGIDNLVYKIQPDEIYNLGSMSHVKVSFDVPVYTGDVTGLAVCRILEAIRQGVSIGILDPKIKFYQASSSEMFGQTPTPKDGYDETSQMTPVSPYGCAKLYGYHITKTYRTGFNLYAANGILFNHESPRRGPTFVTRKVTRAAARIATGRQSKLMLGNINALRDWGHSKDYMKAIHLILQQDKPDDYVVATGMQYSVEDFVKAVFNYWKLNYMDYLITDRALTRPNEVPNLLGNSAKIRKLGWNPDYNFYSLVAEMCEEDMKLEKRLHENH